MAKPIFLLCCTDVIEDRITGLLSLVKVIDQLSQAASTQSGPPSESAAKGGSALSLSPFVVATWQREDESDQEIIDFEIGFRNTDGDLTVLQKGSFSFSKPRHRFIIRIGDGRLPLSSKDGIAAFSCRLTRENGQTVEIECPIILNVVQESDSSDDGGQDS